MDFNNDFMRNARLLIIICILCLYYFMYIYIFIPLNKLIVIAFQSFILLMILIYSYLYSLYIFAYSRYAVGLNLNKSWDVSNWTESLLPVSISIQWSYHSYRFNLCMFSMNIVYIMVVYLIGASCKCPSEICV